MKLLEAFKLLNLARERHGPEFHVAFVTGCSALSLPTFLVAHLSQLRSDKRYKVIEAPYGDIINSIQSAYRAGGDGMAIILDYTSLDARLGLRRASSWNDKAILDIIENVQARLDLISACISGSKNIRTAIHPPVLKLPPIAGNGSWQTGVLEANLDMLWARFQLGLSHIPGVFFVSPESTVLARDRDVDGELTADFPYDQETASGICAGLAKVIVPPVALKGIISDLDDTMWRGLVGEVGRDGVHWNLDGKSQIHAIYQQLLAGLASRGILIAIASKNDQSVVDDAIARDDMLIKADQIFPILASWEQKSQSVSQILKSWNIGADAVVFIDDNPYELDEVKRVHPDIQVMQFYPNDSAHTYASLIALRDQCHKENQTEEDAIRLASLRAAAQVAQEAAGAVSMEAFLEGLDATIGFERVTSIDDRRPFELLNKTNQFNLNGQRYTDAEWNDRLENPDMLCMAITYADKFGSLGRIGVLLGQVRDQEFLIEQWVLSCRAFGRRIEHATLRLILDLYPGFRVGFAYQATPKNRPLKDMIGEFIGDDGQKVSAKQIAEALPPIYARISLSELHSLVQAS